jgi:hypothetical protein
MNSSEYRDDRFSSSDEAFFHAGIQAEQEPLSERPVTLEAEAILADTPARLSARDARRARLQRAVTSTLAALSLLALVGLGRYALRPGIAASERPKSGVVAVAVPVDPTLDTAYVEAPSGELMASIGAASDDDGTWLDPSLAEVPATSRLIGPEPAAECSAPEVSVAVEPLNEAPSRTAQPPAAKHAGARPSKQAPARHGATQSQRRVKVAPVSKSALLRAIRAS